MTEMTRLVTRVKKGVFLLAFVSFVQASVQTVYAGEINSEETRLLQLIQQTFSYEGKTYKVSDSYIEMTKEYLMQDDVDFTSAEVDQLLAKIKSNVATGVAEGYLSEVGLEADEVSKPEDKDAAIKDENVGTDAKEDETLDSKDEIKDGTKQQETLEGVNEKGTVVTKTDGKKVSTEQEEKQSKAEETKQGKTQEEPVIKDGNSESRNTTTQLVDEMIEDKKDADQSSEIFKEEGNSGDGQTTETEIHENQVAESIIKDTGFSISVTITVGFAVFILFFIGLIVAYRVRNFANEDD